MITAIIGLCLAIALRILMGYLATVYAFLEPWTIPFTVLVAALALLVLILIIIKIVESVRKIPPKRDKGEKK